MHRKKPFSGKQKKLQLKDKKQRKKDGPAYLAGDSSEDDQSSRFKAKSAGTSSSCPKKETTGFSDHLEILKVHEQPRRGETTKLDTNSFRLHFLKEDDDELARRKKEAMKPYIYLDKVHLEYKVEDVFPPDAKLNFPKRPPWNYRLSKEQLEEQERDYFKNYVADILDQPRVRDLSFFEMNLETWRQLWRVLEISDILLVIADIRYPVVHIPPSLICHILSDLNKSLVIVLNKVDFVPAVLALAWKHYLQLTFPGIHIVFFSSYPRGSHPGDNAVNFDPTAEMYRRSYKGKHALPVGASQLLNIVKEIVQNKVDLSSWEKKVALSSELSQPDQPELGQDSGGGSQDLAETSDKSEYVCFKDGVVTIGCLGYPNVGKSSVMNALIGKKVVSVSKTPGHTKHLQTFFLCPTVRLCDCPGLVFPSMVPRALQVIAGIFPVAQVKEPYSVVQFLAQRLDLPKLLKLTPPNIDAADRGDYKWTAFDICEAWAIKCGFTTSMAGRPDTYRAANHILRLAAEGQLCLCFRPPGFSQQSDKLTNDPEASHLADSFSSHTNNSVDNQFAEQQEEEDSEDEEESDDGSDKSAADDNILITSKTGMFDKLLELDVDD